MQDRRQLLRAAVFVAGVLAVFVVPFALPPSNGISMSYRVGFNNHLALVTLLAVTLGFGLWTRGWGLHLGLESKPPLRHRAWVWLLVGLLIALPGLLAAAMWLRAPWSRPGSEADYFLDRYAMFDLGYRPFRTMTFDYGPLMFYPVVWLSRLTHGSLRNSFFLCWGAAWIAGTALLWDGVRRLAAPVGHRVAAFGALLVLLLPSIYSGGLNYTPLRYVLAPWFAVLVYQVHRRSIGRALVLAFGGVCITLLYSPEQGIGFLLATLLFFAVCVRTRAVAMPLVLFAVACGVLLAAAKRAGLLQTMLDFGGGGYDFPLLLSTRTVLLVALLIIAGCVVLQSFYDGATDRPKLYLVAVALCLLPSALGRADAGHLLVNTLAAVVVVLLVVWRTPGMRVPSMALAAALVGHVLWTQVVPGFYRTFGPHLVAHARQMLHPPGTGGDAATTAELAAVQMLLRGTSLPTLFAPLGYPQPALPTVPLPIATGRFFGFGLVSERFVQAKLDEIEQRQDHLLLVPAAYRGFCWTPDAVYLHEVLRAELNPWYVPTVKHTGNAALPMCLYLRDHYTPAAQASPVPDFVLLQRADEFRSSR